MECPVVLSRAQQYTFPFGAHFPFFCDLIRTALTRLDNKRSRRSYVFDPEGAPMRKEKARVWVGQAGCGYWGPNLLRNLHANPNCRLAAVAEAAADRREFIAERFPDARLYEDWRELVADPSLQ